MVVGRGCDRTMKSIQGGSSGQCSEINESTRGGEMGGHKGTMGEKESGRFRSRKWRKKFLEENSFPVLGVLGWGGWGFKIILTPEPS